MNRPKAVIIGAGALGLGFLVERLAPDYDLCLADLNDRMPLMQNIVSKSGFTVSVCGLSEIRAKRVAGSFGAVSMDDSHRLCDVLRQADLILTATSRRVLDSLVPQIAAALEGNAKRQWVLFCENGLNIADAFAGSFGRNVATVDTVMSRMCRFAESDEAAYEPMWPGSEAALVVEDYDYLPLDREKCSGGAFSKAFSLVSAEEFACREDMKLYMHNGAHAFLAYHARLEGTELFKDISPELLDRAHRVMFEELVPAVERTHRTVDPKIVQSNGTNLLQRFVSPTFNDTIARGVRGAAEKLEPGERLFGGCEYIRRAGIEPVEYASTVEAARRLVEMTGGGA